MDQLKLESLLTPVESIMGWVVILVNMTSSAPLVGVLYTVYAINHK